MLYSIKHLKSVLARDDWQDHYAQGREELRRWCIHSGFKTHVQSTEVRNREYQWLHKITTNFKKNWQRV